MLVSAIASLRPYATIERSAPIAANHPRCSSLTLPPVMRFISTNKTRPLLRCTIMKSGTPRRTPIARNRAPSCPLSVESPIGILENSSDDWRLSHRANAVLSNVSLGTFIYVPLCGGAALKVALPSRSVHALESPVRKLCSYSRSYNTGAQYAYRYP